eukprot:755479-Hanusia_phi.AAC.2
MLPSHPELASGLKDTNSLPVGSTICVIPNWQAVTGDMRPVQEDEADRVLAAGNGQRICI